MFVGLRVDDFDSAAPGASWVFSLPLPYILALSKGLETVVDGVALMGVLADGFLMTSRLGLSGHWKVDVDSKACFWTLSSNNSLATHTFQSQHSVKSWYYNSGMNTTIDSPVSMWDTIFL